jgi:asparagine synthetase B (glutamine-hydrolysing)
VNFRRDAFCGISGKLEFDSEAKITRTLLKRTAGAIVHRGPEYDEYYGV